MTLDKDFDDYSESKSQTENLEKDLQPLFSDSNKAFQCSVKIMSITSSSVKVNVAINVIGDKIEIKSFLKNQTNEVKNKELAETKTKVENMVYIGSVGKFF